jgi:hypothetical protein
MADQPISLSQWRAAREANKTDASSAPPIEANLLNYAATTAV